MDSRKLINRHLSRCSVDGWIHIEEVTLNIKREAPFFLKDIVFNILIHVHSNKNYSYTTGWSLINDRFV